MVTIAKRFRAFVTPPSDEWESLDELRKRTRETLNRPYNLNFEHSHEEGETSVDMDRIFRPFGNVVSVDTVPARDSVSWRRVLVPLLVLALLLGGLVVWQYWQRSYTNIAAVSPIPGSNLSNFPSGNSNTQPVGEIVPPGTKLEPGGPYTGTGSTQPPSSGSTNLGGGGGAVAPQTCPSGFVCSGTALDRSPCTADNPCKVIKPTDPLTIPSDLIYTGAPGCTLTAPCVLIHSS